MLEKAIESRIMNYKYDLPLISDVSQSEKLHRMLRDWLVAYETCVYC